MPRNFIFLGIHFCISKRTLIFHSVLPLYALLVSRSDYMHPTSLRELIPCNVSHHSTPILVSKSLITIAHSLNARAHIKERSQTSQEGHNSYRLTTLLSRKSTKKPVSSRCLVSRSGVADHDLARWIFSRAAPQSRKIGRAHV